MDKRLEFFTQKLNSLRVKEATLNASGYKTPAYIQKDIRITEIAIDQIKKGL